MWCLTQDPCFSIYFSSRNPKKATEFTEELQSVHNNRTSHVNLNTSICLSFTYVTCKKSTANLKLNDNLIVSPGTSTLSMVGSASWHEYKILNVLDWSNDWLLVTSDGIVSVDCRDTNWGPSRKLFRHCAFSSGGTSETPLWNPVWETLL